MGNFHKSLVARGLRRQSYYSYYSYPFLRYYCYMRFFTLLYFSFR